MPYSGVPDKYTKKMESCVSQVMAKEPGMDKGRAVAICKSRVVPKTGRSAGMDLTRPVPVPIRRIGVGDRFRCYAVRFNGPDDKDLYDTYFDANTEYMTDYYKTRPWLYDHGLHPAIGSRKIGEWDVMSADEHGVFVEGELDRHHKFRNDVEMLIDEGVLYPSSGTLSYLARIADDGHVEQWPIAEVTSTVRPGDWRMLDSISPAARSAMRMLLEKEIEYMEVGEMNLGQLKELLGIGDATATTTRSDGETDADTETEDTDPTSTVADAEGGGETDTDEEELETARAIFGMVNDQFTAIRSAIEGLDGVVHEMGATVEAQQSLLEGLAQDEVTRTREAVTGTDWYKNLHVASREGPEATEDEQDQAGDDDGGDNDATGWERISGQA